MIHASMQAAWELVMRWPFPYRHEVKADLDTKWVMRFLPVVGIVLGMAGVIGFVIIGWLVSNWLAQAVAGALLLVFGNWWMTRARGINGFIRVATGWPVAVAGDGGTATVWQLSANQGMVLLKLVATGILLAAGSPLWYLVVPVISWAAYADIGTRFTSDESGGTGPVHWYIAAAVMLVVAMILGLFIPGLLAVLLGWLGAPLIFRWLIGAGKAEGQDAALATVECVEVLVLWVGILAI